jgi:glycosyltransferase involved in cell wall biosynthesis
VLIRGAGVNLSQFRPVVKKNPIPVIVLVARMLRDKGVNEYVAAAHQLHEEGVVARFLLVGAPDPMNPTSIPEKTLNAWHGSKGLEWVGWCQDIPEVLERCDVMCLPSYREGLPKSLIEAAACGLPIVTTDTPGCREVVRNGYNGFLVPVREVPELVKALKNLIQNPELRDQLGRNSVEIATEEFSSVRVIAETLSLYKKLLPSVGAIPRSR